MLMTSILMTSIFMTSIFIFMGRDILDWDVINMFFPKSRHDKEIVWMLTHYVLYVWENVHVKESDVKLDQFIGYLKFKYKQFQIKLNDLQIFI